MHLPDKLEEDDAGRYGSNLGGWVSRKAWMSEVLNRGIGTRIGIGDTGHRYLLKYPYQKVKTPIRNDRYVTY